MAKKKTNEEFIKEVYELVGDEYLFLENYIDAKTKIQCRHNICETIYSVTPNNFLRGQRCLKCDIKNKTKTNTEFVKEVYNLVKDEYLFLEEYRDSKAKIKCRHNICGYEWSVRPSSFLSGNRCPKCSKKLADNIHTKTNERFKKDVFDLVRDEYTFLEEYINNYEKIRCKHNICGYEWDITPNQFLSSKSKCPSCSASAKKTNNQFVREVYDLVNNEYIFLDKYINARTKILCRHNTCEYEYMVTPNDFLNGRRCPQCNRPNYDRDDNQFKQEIYDLVGNEYEFIEEYINVATKIKCRHNECGHEYKVTPNHFFNGTRCPQCAESKGEEKVRMHLQNKNVKYQQEYSFDSLIGIRGRLLRFDFAIFDKNNDLKILIEYDGEFHYQDIYEDGSFETLQMHDKRKDQYCKESNIPLLRIPYWEFDNIEEILNGWINKIDC